MGLKNIKSVKDYKRIKEFLTAMEYYGITEADLENIKLIPTIIENQKTIITYFEAFKGNKANGTPDLSSINFYEGIEELNENE